MKKDRKFKIDRRLLIAAAVIAIILTILNFCDHMKQNPQDMSGNMAILIRTMVPDLFLFAALRFPSMIYSTVLAGIGAFWSVCLVFMIPAAFLLELTESSPLLVVPCILSLILALMSGAEAVSWIRELRDRRKVEDAAEGIDRMTAGLITFLRPRMTVALLMFIWFTILSLQYAQMGLLTPISSYNLFLLLFPAWALATALYIVSKAWKYARVSRNLKESGESGQAALDYHRGKSYCKGHVILGSKYIFVEGSGRLVKYSELSKIYHRYSTSGRRTYWNLFAVKKDGTEFLLIELPYAHWQKNYDEFVKPMIDDIRANGPDITIGGPGAFRK